MAKIALLLFLILLFGVTNAQYSQEVQESEKLFELSLEELLSIKVVSASKLEQSQSEAPNIIAAIPKETIKAYGWHSINDVLSYQPGFFIGNDYERRTLGFRGMFEGWNNNRVLMLVDGIPFNDNLYGTAFTWDNTPLNFIKSMEITRGPGGALYGSNAMNGVVSLNTLSAKDIDGVGKARFRIGTSNSRYLDVVTGSENSNLGIVVAFAHSITTGNEYTSLDASGRTSDEGEPLSFRTNDSRDNTYFFGKIYGMNNLEGLTIQYHEQHWSFETGHGWLFVIPDRPENMREYRRITSIRYAPDKKKDIGYEFTTRMQTRGIDWNMRLYNNGAENGYYPNGVSEYLNTIANDLFSRIQVNYSKGGHEVLAGLENTSFYYRGDRSHYANIDMNTWLTPGTQTHFELNPWLEYIHKKPVLNFGGFVQYVSPKLFQTLQVTASGRFDNMLFSYTEPSTPSSNVNQKSFRMLTPRLAIVYTPTQAVSVKAIFGQAFRTPTPTEMFGYNTFTLASNLQQLEPELVTNFDLGVYWSPMAGLNLRANTFWINFQNQIAYSVANENLSTNLYSLETVGAELEAQFANKAFSSFVNITIAKRIGESIVDNTISISDKVTWAPSSMLKFGAMYNLRKVGLSALASYQGRVYRRESDKYTSIPSHRPNDYVDSWFSIDINARYSITSKLEAGLSIKNLLDAERYSIKNFAYPFDYKLEGRQLVVELGVYF